SPRAWPGPPTSPPLPSSPGKRSCWSGGPATSSGSGSGPSCWPWPASPTTCGAASTPPPPRRPATRSGRRRDRARRLDPPRRGRRPTRRSVPSRACRRAGGEGGDTGRRAGRGRSVGDAHPASGLGAVAGQFLGQVEAADLLAALEGAGVDAVGGNNPGDLELQPVGILGVEALGRAVVAGADEGAG